MIFETSLSFSILRATKCKICENIICMAEIFSSLTGCMSAEEINRWDGRQEMQAMSQQFPGQIIQQDKNAGFLTC